MTPSIRDLGRTTTIAVGLIFASSSAAHAQGTAFAYQGQLRDAGATVSGFYDITFRLFDSDVAGIQYGVDLPMLAVDVANGLFTAPLDFGPAVFDGTPRWLEIEVNGVVLSPRQALAATPYAQTCNLSYDSAYAGYALSAGYSFAPWVQAGADLHYLDGNVGIGTAAPTAKLEIGGTPGVDGIRFPDGTLQTTAVFGGGISLPFEGSADIPSPNAVMHLSNSNDTNGSTLWLESAGTNGIGIFSNNSATSGYAYGGLFQANSPDGRAVFGSNSATTGAGLGGRFGSASSQGRAIYCTASATSGETYGIYAEAYSNNGTGIFAIASASTSSTNYGIYGQSNSSNGRGVEGDAPQYGVYGSSSGSSGSGVYGFGNSGVIGTSLAVSGKGVEGNSLNSISGTPYGVYGFANSSSGYAVYASGRTGASGVKNFRIDHPSDPQNKYLLHYSAEGPEPLNIYRGTVITNASGEAWAVLPDYFAEINKEPSYQLTVIDDRDSAAFVQAKVAVKMRGNRFKIRTSAPNTEVSWEVKAFRNDRWVRTYGAPVEVDKMGSEKGTYQHPELYGMPAEKGMNYEAIRRQAVNETARKPAAQPPTATVR